MTEEKYTAAERKAMLKLGIARCDEILLRDSLSNSILVKERARLRAGLQTFLKSMLALHEDGALTESELEVRETQAVRDYWGAKHSGGDESRARAEAEAIHEYFYKVRT